MSRRGVLVVELAEQATARMRVEGLDRAVTSRLAQGGPGRPRL
jgi:hypothetical protein